MLPADNGVHVTFDERLGRWLAVYNASLARVEALRNRNVSETTTKRADTPESGSEV